MDKFLLARRHDNGLIATIWRFKTDNNEKELELAKLEKPEFKWTIVTEEELFNLC